MTDQNKKFLTILAPFIIGFLIVSLFLFLKKPPVWPDEAIFFDICLNLLKKGSLSTDLVSGFIPGIENYSYWYPPVYFLFYSFFYLIFGATLIVARGLTLVLAFLVLWLIYKISRLTAKGSFFSIIPLLILTINKYFQEASLISRMEMLTIFWGLLSFYLFLTFEKKQRGKYLFFSGFFSGLAILTHYIGIIYPASIFCSLIIQKRNFWTKTLKFSTPIIILVSFWIRSFAGNFDLFLLQNIVQINRKHYLDSIFSLILYKPEYFLDRIILIFCLIINAVYVLDIILSKKQRSTASVLVLFLCLFSSTVLLFLKEMWYLVFIYVSFSLTFSQIILRISKKTPALAFLLFLFPVLLSVLIFISGVHKNITSVPKYQTICQSVAKFLPPNARVMISIIPDPYFCLKKLRPDLVITEVPNSPEKESLKKEVFNRVFNRVNYVVYSYFPNSKIEKYLSENRELTLFSLKGPYGYLMEINKLKRVGVRSQF